MSRSKPKPKPNKINAKTPKLETETPLDISIVEAARMSSHQTAESSFSLVAKLRNIFLELDTELLTLRESHMRARERLV